MNKIFKRTTSQKSFKTGSLGTTNKLQQIIVKEPTIYFFIYYFNRLQNKSALMLLGLWMRFIKNLF